MKPSKPRSQPAPGKPRDADREAAKAIVEGRHGDAFSYLGMHAVGGSNLVVRAFRPDAERLDLIDVATGKRAAAMRRANKKGLFVAELSGHAEPFAYRLRARQGEHTFEFQDPYAFPPALGQHDLHYLGEGTHFDSYRKLGAHVMTLDGAEGVNFAVWAPSARRVSVVGTFNEWDGRRHSMRLHPGVGIWEIFIPDLAAGDRYKFEILGPDGRLLPLKADPHAFSAEVPPRTASVVEGPSVHTWNDKGWMKERQARHANDAPMSIYEVHLGSWRRVPEDGERWLTYRELADTLVPYVRDKGFTHIELLPVSEFPFDGSWGYQPIGLFAPTSRFGTPDDFRFFVDRCHQENIGVILDWVPGHFPDDEHGLANFDGSHLYEHADPRQGRHEDWGTLIYNYGRTEVSNFLISNALFWLDEFHIDGLRVDAVASMLYLDYSREDGHWIANEFGGNENLDAIRFLKRLNELVYSTHPGAFTMAEESTAWPMVSRPTYLGGLGFGYKWNMGWMHDTLNYVSKEPIHRKHHHEDLTFGLLYAFHENFVLPLSHDEVVHGKGSILGRMPGDQWQRLANLRAYYTYMFAHPGRKLLFMGAELGQEREWNHDSSLDWHLLEDPMHSGLGNLIADLNRIYRDLPALHQVDDTPGGFAWIDCHDHEQSVLSFLRLGKGGDDLAIVVCNFTPVVRHDYRVGVPRGGLYEEVLNSDSERYGGTNIGNFGAIVADHSPMHGYDWSLTLTLPPLGAMILRPAGSE